MKVICIYIVLLYIKWLKQNGWKWITAKEKKIGDTLSKVSV